ncbi:MAG: hypothetical protein ACQEXJ_24925 [Myxococcota bacterium]
MVGSANLFGRDFAPGGGDVPQEEPRKRTRRLAPFVAALIGALVAVPAAAEDDGPPGWGTRITMHGWSPDGEHVAYTRTRVVPGQDDEPERDERGVHWHVVDGQFAETGPTFGADLARWAERHDYRLEALQRKRRGERRFWFTGPEGVYELVIDVGKRLVWELRFDGRALVRRAFDKVYVGIEPQLYPSPDRDQAVLVMHLDTGFVVDGAVFPVDLPPRVRDRYREVREALRDASRKGAGQGEKGQ